MLFDTWESLARIVLTGVLAYAGAVILLRVSGNRTLSKMNSFDLVVTVAFGSTLSSILVDPKISVAEGLVAIAMLIMLQFVITWLSVRSSLVSRLVKTQPTLLVSDGSLIEDAMKKVRVTEGEIRSVLRKNGLGSVEQVAAVVMGSDGSLSVISKNAGEKLDSLQGVHGYTQSRKY